MAYRCRPWIGVQVLLILLPLFGACSNKPKTASNGASGSSSVPADRGDAGATAGSDDRPGALGGMNEGGASSGADEGGAAGAGGDFVNPVAASESDKDVLGVDADGNGVRDDLDAYLQSLAQDQSEQVLLTSLAREETKMLKLGEDPASTVASVRDQALRSMAVHHCIIDALGADRTRVVLTELQSGLLNSELRWNAWLSAEHLLRGSILRSMSCDSGLVQP